jgi:hypothetical protein
MSVIPQQETAVPDREISTSDPSAALARSATRPRQSWGFASLTLSINPALLPILTSVPLLYLFS